ncbi:MAG: hypothetical protein Q9208_005770 [Pyrenodesmia sp. 3 TL-2023]
MEVPVDDAAPWPIPIQPGGYFEIINESSQRQSIDFSRHEDNIASSVTAVKKHGEDIRRIDADVAGIIARRSCNADRTEQRFGAVEDQTSVIATDHAVLQQRVETSQDDIWQAIEDIRSEVERRADNLNDQLENDPYDIWDNIHALGDLASQAYNTLDALNGRMDGVQTLASTNENEVKTLKERMDGAERHASKTSNQVETLRAYGHLLEEEMRRTAQEAKEMLAQRDAILDRHESTIRGLKLDLATDRLVNELSRLSIDDETPAAENNPPTSNALVPWSARPAVQDATNGRIDGLERTFQAYYRRLRARTARVERIGRENRTQSNNIIRECNVRLARLMTTMQVIDAIHFAIAAALNDHDTALRRTHRITEVLDNHRDRLDATDTRLTDQARRTDHIDGRLDDIDTELRIQSVRTDHVHDRLDEIQTSRDDDLTRMDMTEDRLEAQTNTIHRIDWTLNEIVLNRDDDLTRMDMTEDRLTTNVQRIDGTLNELWTTQQTYDARLEGLDTRVRGTRAQLRLLEQEHTRMSRYVRSRVSDAMDGNAETGMSRAMEDMNAQIQRLGGEVAT